jgi:hypothetical protein
MESGVVGEPFDVPRRDRAVSDWPMRFAVSGYAVFGVLRLLARGVQLNLTNKARS